MRTFNECYTSDKYNDQQLAQLLFGTKEGLNTMIYDDPAFTAAQMQELRRALRVGANTSKYADPTITAATMREMRLKQLRQIRRDQREIKSKWDHTRYWGYLPFDADKPDPYTVYRNEQILKAADLSKFSEDQIDMLYYAAKCGAFLPLLMNPELSADAMDTMLDSLATIGAEEQYLLDTDYFEQMKAPDGSYNVFWWHLNKKFPGQYDELLNAGFSYWQAFNILNAKTDVRSKVTTDTHPEVIDMLDRCQQDGMNVDEFWNPRYTPWQFKNVYLGMLADIDVASYADSGNSSLDMRLKRCELLKVAGVLRAATRGCYIPECMPGIVASRDVRQLQQTDAYKLANTKVYTSNLDRVLLRHFGDLESFLPEATEIAEKMPKPRYETVADMPISPTEAASLANWDEALTFRLDDSFYEFPEVRDVWDEEDSNGLKSINF